MTEIRTILDEEDFIDLCKGHLQKDGRSFYLGEYSGSLESSIFLSDDDFNNLISGDIVEIKGISFLKETIHKIALKDIGYDRIFIHIQNFKK